MCNLLVRSLCLVALTSTVYSAGAAEVERDPTRPLDYRVARASVDLSLNAVLHGGDRRLAVINGQRLREGETIANSGGIRVVRIDAGAVLVGQSGRHWQLKLNNESVRQ